MEWNILVQNCHATCNLKAGSQNCVQHTAVQQFLTRHDIIANSRNEVTFWSTQYSHAITNVSHTINMFAFHKQQQPCP